MTGVDLRMPAGMNFTTTTLGLAVCQPEMLLAQGSGGCPVNSHIGSGSALVEVPFLWLSILAPILLLWPVSWRASLLLLPYLAWVSFAAFLNLTIVQLNRVSGA